MSPCKRKHVRNGLPNRLINIAVPVNFFHRERAFGIFPIIAPGCLAPAASLGLVWVAPAPLLVEEGRGIGLLSVGATPAEECPDAEEIQVEAVIGLWADGWRREAWFANSMQG